MEKDRSVVHILLSSLDKCFKDTFLVHRHQCQDNAPLHTHTHRRIRCADSGGTAPSVRYIMATVSTSSVLWDISIWRLSPDNHNRPLTRSCDKNCKPPTLSLALKHNALTLVDGHTAYTNKPALWTREHSLKLRISPISSSHCQCYQGSHNMNTLKSQHFPMLHPNSASSSESVLQRKLSKTKTHQRPT